MHNRNTNMPRGRSITTEIYCNKLKPQKDGNCPVSIRITYDRKRKYYGTGIQLLSSEFDALFGHKLRPEQKKILSHLHTLESKAKDCIDILGDTFTFIGFERLYMSNTSMSDSLKDAFDNYISDLEESRVGTRNSYGNSRDAFMKFKPKAQIGDITVKFLIEFETWMLEKNKSITTIGIYCRSLRSVLNGLIAEGRISKELYPFGAKKNKKYEIPTAKNTKKALSLDEISLIYNYECVDGSVKHMCRDYWLFLYMAN